MRVLHILNELRPSGAEVMLRVAAKHWKEYGLELDVLSKGTSIGSYAPKLKDAGYILHHVPFYKPLRFLQVYLRLLLRERYDVIHIHTEHANFWLALVALLCGTRRVVRTVHSTFPFDGCLRIKRLIQRRILRAFGVKHISIGASVAQREKEAFANPSKCIFNWYDDSTFKPPTPQQRKEAREYWDIAPNELLLVSIGNCSDVKNHRSIIRAIAELPKDLRIVYVHAGEEKDESERLLAKTLHVDDHIRFIGFITDPVSLLHAADLYVMPSLREGLGNAALEAMAVGLPAILSEVDGLKDLKPLIPGITWTGVDPESITRGIQDLASLTAEERVEIGLAAQRVIADTFRVERGAVSYYRLYCDNE